MVSFVSRLKFVFFYCPYLVDSVSILLFIHVLGVVRARLTFRRPFVIITHSNCYQWNVVADIPTTILGELICTPAVFSG